MMLINKFEGELWHLWRGKKTSVDDIGLVCPKKMKKHYFDF